MEFTPSTMKALTELLRTPEPEVLQGEDLTPTEFEISSSRNKIAAPSPNEKKVPKTIEEFEEQQDKEAEEYGLTGAGLGTRKLPEYTMNYQQAVSAEDVYLQIGPKTTSSASCENLKVRIKLPGDKMENVDLTVDKESVTVSSSQHFLKLQLPHNIDPDASNASWDPSIETLILTLKLDREFDFINF